MNSALNFLSTAAVMPDIDRNHHAGVCENRTNPKGVGAMLLEKMGYKGGGLGKNAQGIVDPIFVKMRPKNMGIGFDNFNSSPNNDHSKKSLRRRQDLDYAEKENPPLKKARIEKNRDYLPKKQVKQTEKVIDMRGPEPIVLTSLKNLNGGFEESTRPCDIPIYDDEDVDESELDTEIEKVRIRAICEDKMEEIVAVLDQIKREEELGTLELDSLADSLWDLRRQYYCEYKLYNLPFVSCSFAVPLFIRLFQRWNPLENPTHGLVEIALWRNLLREGDDSVYTRLFMEVVFPAVRMCGTNNWQATDPEPMLRFLDSWVKVLPPSVPQCILDNIVLPKLSSAVDSWEEGTSPIDSWVHPWLPFMEANLETFKLESFYDKIRYRLESLFNSWDPSNMSAYYVLLPWKKVFDETRWEKLIMRCILPKLVVVMQNFQINPAKQKLDEFQLVLNWSPVIPIHHMVKLMDLFFNKWEQVLYHWLSSKPKFEEVRQWYLGWKELVPPELGANTRIRHRLMVGLEMMDLAIEGMEIVQPGLQENTTAALRSKNLPPVRLGTGRELSLKEVVEDYAQQNGLLFRPNYGRMHDGHQIYGFGKISIVVDSRNQKVFAQSDDRWSLVSFEQLLELHSRRSGRN